MSKSAIILNNVDAQTERVLLPILVGFFFSFRLMIVLLMVRLFQADPKTGAAVGVGLNLFLLVIVVFYSFGPASVKLGPARKIPSIPWVLFFLTFSGCSLFWSVTASLPAAIVYWSALVADVAIVALLMRSGSAGTVSSSLVKGYVYGACAIALVAWLMPTQSDLRLGDEELLGPNQIGYASAFGVFLAQYLNLKNLDERSWRFVAGFLAITLLRSLSKTTILAFIAGEIVLLFGDKSISRKSKIYLIPATGLVITLFWGLFESYYDVYTNAGNQAETLTGRLGIWAVILDNALEQPWIGHGFHSVWKVIPPFGDFEARHAHNELLQQFYTYGVVGVLMLIGLYGSFYRQIRRFPSAPLKTLSLSLIVFVLVRGFADTEVFDLSLPLWLITMVSLCLYRAQTTREVVA